LNPGNQAGITMAPSNTKTETNPLLTKPLEMNRGSGENLLPSATYGLHLLVFLFCCEQCPHQSTRSDEQLNPGRVKENISPHGWYLSYLISGLIFPSQA